jgi:hypothetical protein
VFRINRDGIEFAGLCNRPTLNFPDWLPDIIPV